MRPDAIEIPRSDLSRIPGEAAAPAGAWAALGRFVRDAGRRLSGALYSRHPNVGDFSEAQLRDIGLSRIDVELPGSSVHSIFRRST